jgi:hypothetical protein
MPGLQEEVIQAWEVAVTVEAARGEAVCAVVAYTRERAEASIKEAEA